MAPGPRIARQNQKQNVFGDEVPLENILYVAAERVRHAALESTPDADPQEVASELALLCELVERGDIEAFIGYFFPVIRYKTLERVRDLEELSRSYLLIFIVGRNLRWQIPKFGDYLSLYRLLHLRGYLSS